MKHNKKLFFFFFMVAVLTVLFAFSTSAIKANRPYHETKTIKIIDHVVYEYRPKTYKRPAHYAVIDYFDTNKAAEKAKSVTIQSEVNGLPVTELQVGCRDLKDGTYANVSGEVSGPLVKTITLPDTLKNLGTYAFEGFRNLRKVTLPAGVTQIPEGTFQHCSNLKVVNVCGKLRRIGNAAFEGCRTLRKFRFPNTLVSIGEYAFRNSGLRKIILPSTFSEIEALSAFAGCHDLEAVFFCGEEKDVLVINAGMFDSCEHLTKVTLPKDVKAIYVENDAFRDCYNLETIKHISKVKEIGAYAFNGCLSLTSFTLPKGIEAVHPYAFINCANLKTLYINSTDPLLLQKSKDVYEGNTFDYNANFINFLRSDCMVCVRTQKMLDLVQSEGVHSTAKLLTA